MPVYEYRCELCSKKFDILHKSSLSEEIIMCPSCGSLENKKVFSTFAAQSSSGSDFGSCSDGSCDMPGMPAGGGCCGGSCSHN